MVVPAYRHLSDDEKISMRQCVDVLGGHDIIVIHPERLDLTEDLQSWQSVVVKALCNEWFDGVKGYNSMLLSTEFYDLFSAYDYILIYQLDAYVFRNELDEWVAKGYDYIGAPWIIKRGCRTICLAAGCRRSTVSCIPSEKARIWCMPIWHSRLATEA